MVEGTARTNARSRPSRDLRVAKLGSARSALAGFGRDADLYCLTFGQFSLLDAVEVLLDVTGPAHVTVSTWTAGTADLTRARRFLDDARLLSLRFIVDRSFLTRQPGYAARLVELFGDDAIRTTRTHAKFVTIRNDEWDVAVRTSMNMNENPRLEHIEVSDDRQLAEFLTAVVDAVYADEPPGLDGPRSTPSLSGVAGVEPPRSVATSTVPVAVGPP